eukprot:4624134-Ditylum_brightwellii.AAC.1
MAVHQYERFTNAPMLSHERAIRRITKYLTGTANRGVVYNPERGIECHVNADFAGSWSKTDTDNPENLMSRPGCIVFYAGCPVLWSSKLQTEIALSTAETEYIALSTAMREVAEDNQSCIAIAESNKCSPRTKYIAL